MAPSTTASPAPADPNGGPVKPPPKRGRKPDPSTEPNRSRDLQRLYRARRVAQLADLEARVAVLERENAQLRRRLGEDVPDPEPSRPSTSAMHLDSPGSSIGSPAGTPGATPGREDVKPPVLNLPGAKPIPGPEIDLTGVPRPPIGFTKPPVTTPGGGMQHGLSPNPTAAGHGHLIGQSPASDASSSPGTWAHHHFAHHSHTPSPFASTSQPPTAAPTPAPFSPADTVWGAEMLQAVQAQAFAAAGVNAPPAGPNSHLLANLGAQHFAHHFNQMGYAHSPRAQAETPTNPYESQHALPSSPDLLYNHFGAPPSTANTPASSAYSPWPSSSGSTRLPDGTLVHTPGSLATSAPSPPTPPSNLRVRPFRPPPPTPELQRLFLSSCCFVPPSDLPPAGLSPTQMSPFHIFCLVLLRGLELTGKGQSKRLSWTPDEERQIAAQANNEQEEKCCGGMLDCSGAIFEDEPSVLDLSPGFVKASQAWQVLWTIPRNRFTPMTLAESVLTAGEERDPTTGRVHGVSEDGSKRVSWNVRCEPGHGLIVKLGALEEVKREVEEAVGLVMRQPSLAGSSLGVSVGTPAPPPVQAKKEDEYDPRASLMPWMGVQQR